MKDTRKHTISKEMAVTLLNEGDTIHTFRQGGFGLIGCDWSRINIINKIDLAKEIEIGGEACQSMGHALVLHTESGPLFVEANKEKIAKLEIEFRGEKAR